jgi:hypothetical protein
MYILKSRIQSMNRFEVSFQMCEIRFDLCRIELHYKSHLIHMSEVPYINYIMYIQKIRIRGTYIA